MNRTRARLVGHAVLHARVMLACALVSVGCRDLPRSTEREPRNIEDDLTSNAEVESRPRVVPAQLSDAGAARRERRMTPCRGDPAFCPPGYVCSTDLHFGCHSSGAGLPNCNGGICVTPKQIEAVERAYPKPDPRDDPWAR